MLHAKLRSLALAGTMLAAGTTLAGCYCDPYSGACYPAGAYYPGAYGYGYYGYPAYSYAYAAPAVGIGFWGGGWGGGWGGWGWRGGWGGWGGWHGGGWHGGGWGWHH